MESMIREAIGTAQWALVTGWDAAKAREFIEAKYPHLRARVVVALAQGRSVRQYLHDK